MSDLLDEFLRREARNNDVVVLRRLFVEATNYDLPASIMLSQIFYWMCFRRGGESRTSIEFEGKRWVAKRAEDWLEECFLTVDQARRCIEKLRDLKLIETSVRHFKGAPVTHITLTEKIIEIADLGFSPNRAYMGPKPESNSGQNPNTSIYGSETTPENTDLLGDKSPEEKKPPKKPKTPRKSRPDITFRQFVEHCEEIGEDAIHDDDPIFRYIETIKLPVSFLQLAWKRFNALHAESQKRQKDWRAHFRDCVRGNWYKFWWIKDGEYLLTTSGQQAQMEYADQGETG